MKTYHDLEKALAHPEEVQELSLPKQKIKTLPDEVGSLKNVEKINLAYNNLKELPASFAHLKKLKQLKLGSNNFHYIPEVILELPQLEFLNIRRNRLKKIPEDIHKLQNLKSLIAYANQLKTLPETISHLPCLQCLDISENPDLQLKEVFSVLASVPQLFELQLRRLKIHRLPSNFILLQNLASLELLDNPAIDIEHLVDLLLQMPHCKHLKLDTMPDKLPAKFEQLNYLEGLTLTQLDENQHIAWHTFTRLKELNLNNCRLTELPDWVLKLKDLEVLHLQRNKLGELPKEIVNLKKLRSLSIADNQLHTPPTFLLKIMLQLEHLGLEYTGYVGTEALSGFYKIVKKTDFQADEKRIAPLLFERRISPGQVEISQLMPFLSLDLPHVRQYILALISSKNTIADLPQGSKIAFVGKSKRFTLAKVKKAIKSQGWTLENDLVHKVDCLVLTGKTDSVSTTIWQNENLRIVSDYQWQEWMCTQSEWQVFTEEEVQKIQGLLASEDSANHLLALNILSGESIIPQTLYPGLIAAYMIHKVKKVEKLAQKIIQKKLPPEWLSAIYYAKLWGTQWIKALIETSPIDKQALVEYIYRFASYYSEPVLEFGGSFFEEVLESNYKNRYDKTQLILEGDFRSLSKDLLKWKHLPKIKSLEILKKDYQARSPLNQIPEVIFDILHLEELSLCNTSLQEVTTKIAQLEKLKTLILDIGKLTKLPKEITQLKVLERLSLYHNHFQELPLCIGQLDRLKDLNISRNPLKHIPDFIQALAHLEYLDISATEIDRLPAWINKITQLTHLSCSKNQIQKTPASLFELTNLERLELAYNQITELPLDIVRLSHLDTLILSHNQLSSLPREIGQLKELRTLEVTHNPLTHIPDEIAQLEKLEVVSLGNKTLLSDATMTRLRHLLPDGCRIETHPGYY